MHGQGGDGAANCLAKGISLAMTTKFPPPRGLTGCFWSASYRVFDFKEVVLPAETPQKTVEETLKTECKGGWQVERKVADYRGDPAFHLYVLKKAKDQETLEEQIASQEEATGKLIPGASPVAGENQISAPEPPPVYRPAGNF